MSVWVSKPTTSADLNVEARWPMAFKEPDHAQIALSWGTYKFENQPVDALHFQRDVIGQHLASTSG